MGSNKKLISDILKTLSKMDRDSLKLAHEYGVQQYIKLPNNRFIGVHLNGARHLITHEAFNDWSIGEIKYPN